MPDLERIRRRLKLHQPMQLDPREADMLAAVDLILHEPNGQPPELLFIERARRDGDPWSGQMAFPGGRNESADADLQVTAMREAFEEVGVRLNRPIGQLNDLAGGSAINRRLLVAPYVYALEERPQLRPNHEVNSVVWVPLRWLLNPDSAAQYRFEHESFSGRYPAFRYHNYTVWGLTYRITADFMKVLGRALPSDQNGTGGEEQSD